jgi:hypothetical protein
MHIRPGRLSRAKLSNVTLTIALAILLSGCGARAPRAIVSLKAPKVRVEGPPGTSFGYSITYLDGADVDASGTGKTIPASGVYTEDLKKGHQGVLVELIPTGSATLTLIILDETQEIQRATAKGDKETARVMAGLVTR